MQPSAQTAIKTLETMRQSRNTDVVAYWATPNVILTLSGARAYCDGVFWHNNKRTLEKWAHEIEQAIEIVRGMVPCIYAKASIKEARPGEQYASFEIVTRPGLEYVLAHSKLLRQPLPQLREQGMTLPQLFSMLEAAIRQNQLLTSKNNEDINDAAFGILLGYPDEAILGLLQAEDQYINPFAEPTINADIRGARYYDCPQPVYMYPRHLIDNPAIKAHEKLWSQILDDYFHSDFHRSLERTNTFRQKMIELGSLNESLR